MKARFTAAAAAATLGFAAVFTGLTALPASAHGWVTDPPSRQDYCASGATSFDCGSIKYEPQSVEAPKGSMQCSGGNAAFAILDDKSKPWPVKNVGSSITVQWKLTAAHNTSLWEYFVDGQPFRTFDQSGRQPASDISHTLTNLPAGEHTVLARWNVSNTGNAFYSCMDINVTEGDSGSTGGNEGSGNEGTGNEGSGNEGSTGGSGNEGSDSEGSGNNDGTSGNAETCPPAYSAEAVYVGGDTVTHNGHIWRTKWWTQGQAPGTTGEWGQWEDLGPCSPGSPNGNGSEGNGSEDNGQGGTDQPGSGGDDSDTGDNPGDSSGSDDDSNNNGTDDGSDNGDDDGTVPAVPGTGDEKIVGYFANWGVYTRDYHVKNIKTSGSAEKMTHILYAFGNVQNGKCVIGDSYADYDKAYTAAQSVDGVADTWDQPLRGNFNQLRKLKAEFPHIKVIWSFGGWTYSGGFGQAAQNPAAFAKSCHDLVEDPRWADVFDGIDIDWEYPNACGETCDNSGWDSYRKLIKALRDEFGNDLITSAIGADPTTGGKIDAADYAGAAQYLDWLMPMTYDFFGAWDAKGPTAPHSPLTSYPRMPIAGYDTSSTITKLKGMGIPANKILLGIGFYGRGWTGVTQAAPGGTATGPAAASTEAGIEDYKVLKKTCPATGSIGGTSYGFCNGNWWGYDTPSDVINKMNYAKQQGLGGAFVWELSGDTANGEMMSAIRTGLN